MTARRSLAGAFVLALAAVGADWPQFLGPERNGTSPETGLAASLPKMGPPLAWEREVGEGFSGPVILGDRLILFNRLGDKEVIECLDAATGKAHWKFDYATTYQDAFGKGDGPRATPTVASGRVYALGAEGTLTCLDLDKGTKLWQRSLEKDYRPRKGFFGVATSPLVEGDLVLVNVGARGAGIVAFDKDSGKEVWKATDQEASYASPVAATIDGVRHVLFFTREGLVSLDPANGSVRFSKRWRSRIDASVNAASPLVADGHVFLTASYGTGAILLKVKKDGVEEVWKGNNSLSCHFGTPVLRDGHLYGFEGRQEQGAKLRCVEWKTGKVCWTRDGFGCGSLIAADGKLLVLSEDGDLVLVQPTPDGYREQGRAGLLKGPCRAPIALAGGRLYARDGQRLGCWDLRK
jgi:outer membrane protein assembly factor BamB